ncbi:hypothetical protein ACFX19_020228 [Malus domestica]
MTPVYNPSVVVGKNVLNELERLMEDVNGAMRIAMGNLPDFQDDSFADMLNEEACNGDKNAGVVVGKNVLNELERLMEDVNGAMRIAMGNLPDFQDDSFADRLNEEACNGDKNASVVVGKNVLNELERLMEDVNGAMRIAMGNLPDFQDDSFADRLNEEACNGDKVVFILFFSYPKEYLHVVCTFSSNMFLIFVCFFAPKLSSSTTSTSLSSNC